MKRSTFLLLALGYFGAAVSPIFAGSVYSTGFEAPTFKTGIADSQDGWFQDVGPMSAISVVTTPVLSGGQSVRISASGSPNGTRLARFNTYDTSANTDKLVDLRVSMLLSSAGTPGEYHITGFNATGAFVGYVVVSSTGALSLASANGQEATGVTVTRNVWHTYDLQFNYVTRTINLVFDNTLVASGKPFAGGANQVFNGEALEAFPFSTGTDQAFFDDFSLTTGPTYYFPHLTVGAGWQTTLTLINYSTTNVTCTTRFFSDSGTALPVAFAAGTNSFRVDNLAPGQALHDPTVSNVTAPLTPGWAQSVCSGPVQANLLYRFFQQGKATGEAAVNPSTVPTTKFVTFAETSTGVAYANPSTTLTAIVTLTAVSNTGTILGKGLVNVLPGGHGAVNVGPFLGLPSFTGFVEITATSPIVSLSLNAEAFPVFSSLPPGDLTDATSLAVQ